MNWSLYSPCCHAGTVTLFSGSDIIHFLMIFPYAHDMELLYVDAELSLRIFVEEQFMLEY
jgi:hypothetical protein